MAAKKKAKGKTKAKRTGPPKARKSEDQYLSAKIVGQNLQITVPLLAAPKKSASGKTLSIARDQRVALEHEGKEVTVGGYAFVDA